jgi:hypothetical protein
MVDFKQLQPNQKLRIKTENGVIIGTFMKLAGQRMQIQNPQKLDGSSLGKFMWIYKCDIKNIKADWSGELKHETKVVEEQRIFNPSITNNQRQGIEKLMDATIYINQFDMTYHNAVKDIRGNFYIGIHAENDHRGR